jgi:hypothetical protein
MKMLKLVALRGDDDTTLKPIVVLDITDFDLSRPADRLRLCEVLSKAIKTDCGYYEPHEPPEQTDEAIDKGAGGEVAASLFPGWKGPG